MMVFVLHRVLRTPTEEIWPGVSELPDYKSTFPKWTDLNLGGSLTRLADNKLGMDLLGQMLIYSPADRITAKKAIQHEFFKDFDTSCLPSFDNNVA